MNCGLHLVLGDAPYPPFSKKRNSDFKTSKTSRLSSGMCSPLPMRSDFHHPEKLFHLLQDAHAQWTLGPIHDQFGMFPPKRFGHVAAPADGPVFPQRFLQLFGRDLVPLNSLAL